MKTKGIGVYFIILALVLLAMWWMTTGKDYDNTYNYTNFIEDLNSGKVQDLEIIQNAEVPTGELKFVLVHDNEKDLVSIYVPDVKDVLKDLEEIGYTKY
ncbi:MAG: ATP-dependent metallopeptidase FtsH/Yme1/Tma family protein, partial [Lachnospiraceae bacterium]|nr:ATP-dependent metallopeptidase FtsH/Yme1/Tma family protein [Lachnospiraceae bacterium]